MCSKKFTLAKYQTSTLAILGHKYCISGRSWFVLSDQLPPRELTQSDLAWFGLRDESRSTKLIFVRPSA